MRQTDSRPDPVDAVLGGDNEGEDLLDVAVLVHDLQAAYRRPQPLELGAELVAFTGTHLLTDHDVAPSDQGVLVGEPDGETHGRKRHPMLTGLSGFVGTLTGKFVLGTAVTAASVGGLHAADVVDVPVLPDTAASADRPEQSDGSQGTDVPDAAVEGQATAEGNRAAADAYSEAVQAWTDCVATAAAANGDNPPEAGDGFDPSADCGDQPNPTDYGLADLPEQAADAAQDAPRSAPDGATPDTPAPASPAGTATTVPTESGDPTDRGTNTPAPNSPVPDSPASPDTTVPVDAGDPTDRGTEPPTDGRP